MKITVAIPTIAGRENYLTSCLETCVLQDYDNFEIIVSDNSGNNNLDIIKSFCDKRIKYVKPPTYLPMSKHWDYVLTQITGDLFTIIGDDDGLMPNCVNRIDKIASEFSMRIIKHSYIQYYWPDAKVMEKRNKIIASHDIDYEARIKKGIDVFRCLCNGSLTYLDAPMVYHNFVPTTIVKNLSNNGHFFRRASPDVFSSVALSLFCEQFISLSDCLTISGIGGASNGYNVRKGMPNGTKFLAENETCFKARFHPDTIHFAVMDSIYEVAEAYDLHEIIKEIEIPIFLGGAASEALLISGIKRKFSILGKAAKIAYENGVTVQTLCKIMVIMLEKVSALLSKKKSSQAVEYLNYRRLITKGDVIDLPDNVRNICQATQFFSEYLNGKNC